jgi:hypothetical protein
MYALAAHNIYLFFITSAQLRSQCDVWLALKASLQTVQHALHAASESGCYFWFVSNGHPLPHTTHSFKQSPMLGPASNQHRMTAIKQQVVLIIYSNPTPLALALCVSDAVLGIALNWGSIIWHQTRRIACWWHSESQATCRTGAFSAACNPP